MNEDVVLLHGGAGSKDSFSERLSKYAMECSNIKDSLEAVIHSVRLLEDDPEFNAGTGSVKRIDGSIQMDAAVMIPGKLGSVIGIERVKNPVEVARMVMEKTPHLILEGDGATTFARKMGFHDYDPSTERSENIWKKTVEYLSGKNEEMPKRYENYLKFSDMFDIPKSTDTVGAVARIDGKFAGAVSTGGASPMMRGRVGDVPLPGCGIYVGEKGAVVATGIGEEIIRRMFCHNIYMQISKESLRNILEREVEAFNGIEVGVIAVSGDEHASFSNTSMATGLFSR
ncbi:MAG: isoaspartyl peptidase/L-asparaginase [Candidatus Thermoplasmatota archaeon]|nr:isoaspartyl peptidase/L-asparaginase [Candidatus Thermoplasmatota archaeon]